MELFRTITGDNGFLQAFYAAIKAAAADPDCVARTFITGVSSVSLDTLTSGSDSSRNVTSWACFNAYAGFTEDELAELISLLVDLEQLGLSGEELIARMKPAYGGYCFSQETLQTVFNPSMCLYYLDEMRVKGRFLPPEDVLDPASDHDGTKLRQLFDIAQTVLLRRSPPPFLPGEAFC